MPMLPATRPLSANYGEDLENEHPVADPTRDLDAEHWNGLKHDAAYAARMCPLLMVLVTVSGGVATVTTVRGPENAAPAQVTATRTGTGEVNVNWSGTGVVGIAVVAFAQHATDAIDARTRAVTPSTCTVSTRSDAGAVADASFVLMVF